MKVICKTYWEKRECKQYCMLAFPDANKDKARELLKEIISKCNKKPKFERIK